MPRVTQYWTPVQLPAMVPQLAGTAGFERLIDEVAAELAREGSMVVAAADLPITSRLWRHAARQAGLRVGCRVATGREGGGPILEDRDCSGPDGWSVWARLAPPG